MIDRRVMLLPSAHDAVCGWTLQRCGVRIRNRGEEVCLYIHYRDADISIHFSNAKKEEKKN